MKCADDDGRKGNFAPFVFICESDAGVGYDERHTLAFVLQAESTQIEETNLGDNPNESITHYCFCSNGGRIRV